MALERTQKVKDAIYNSKAHLMQVFGAMNGLNSDCEDVYSELLCCDHPSWINSLDL